MRADLAFSSRFLRFLRCLCQATRFVLFIVLLLRLAEVGPLELLLGTLFVLGQFLFLVAVEVFALIAVLLLLDPTVHHRALDVATDRLTTLDRREADLTKHGGVLERLADDD